MIKPFALNLYLLSFFALPIILLSPAKDLYNDLNNRSLLLQDTIPPTVYCVTGETSMSLSANGCITIQAKDFDLGSFDNFSTTDKLKFYFDGNKSKDSIKICCDDFALAGVFGDWRHDVEMWVEDEHGNTAFCNIAILFKDNLDICKLHEPYYFLKGSVFFGNTKDIIETKYSLSRVDNFSRELSGTNYSFINLKNGKYKICLDKNDEPTNGVSIADILKIGKHILGTEVLNTPYKIMAADVNKSQNITSADNSEIRRLILGLKTKFSNVPSWIFVPKNLFIVPNKVPNIGLFIPSCDTIEIKNQSIEDRNYVAIKMGDVTLNARGTNFHHTESRQKQANLIYQSKNVANNLVQSDFSIDENFDLSGMQFSLVFNINEFEFLTFKKGNIDIEDEHYTLHDLPNGKIHIAWDNNLLDKGITSSGTLFSIIWKKKSAKNNSPILSFDFTGVQALIVDYELNEIDLTLNHFEISLPAEIKIHQDYTHQTILIEGELTKKTNAHYSIIDITGRKIYQKSVLLNEGLIQESIPTSMLPSKGMYFFRMQVGDAFRSLKILNII